MWETVPWTVAAAFALLFLLRTRGTRNNALKARKQSEFIAILFIEKDAYNANRKAFMDWVKKEIPVEDETESVMLVLKAAEQIATSYIDKAGAKTGGLGATLAMCLTHHGHIQRQSS